LLAHNAKVYIAVRNEEKAKSAIAELKEQTGKEAFFLKLDLADLESVKSSAEEFIRYARSIYNIPRLKIFQQGNGAPCPVQQCVRGL
jgi:retinol dehydrogenase-12